MDSINMHKQYRFIALLFVFVLSLISGCSDEGRSQADFTVGIVNMNAGVQPVMTSFKTEFHRLSEMENRVLKILEPISVKVDDIWPALTELKNKEVDLVLLAGTGATIQAINFFKNSNTKILFTPVYDPIRSGLVSNLVHDTDYITGVKVAGGNDKALSYLLQANPKIKKVYVPLSGKSDVEVFSFMDLQSMAQKLGVELVVKGVSNRETLLQALETMPDDIDALWLVHSMFLVPNHTLFIEAAINNQILLGSSTGLGKEGIMISYGPDMGKLGIQAARLANEIAKGVPLNQLPVETAEFFLKVNVSAAKAAGINLPDGLLNQADYVF